MKQHQISPTDEKDSEYIAKLITGYTYGYLSDEQHDKLDEWVDSSDKNMFLFEDITDESKLKQIVDWLSEVDLPGILQQLKMKLITSR
jgi:transmembrane sensor